MEEDINLDFKPTHIFLMIIIIVIILSGSVFIYIMIDGPNSTNKRIDRVEHLMDYQIFYYQTEYRNINENMSLADIRTLYQGGGHESYKRMGLAIAVDYICDGTGEDTIEGMLR